MSKEETEEKRKAKELILKFQVIELSPPDDICKTFRTQEDIIAKKCALLCVDEIIKYENVLMSNIPKDKRSTFWIGVRKEIEG